MESLSTVCLFLLCLQYAAVSATTATELPTCEALALGVSDNQQAFNIDCTYIGKDGRTLDEVLRQSVFTSDGWKYTFSEIAPLVVSFRCIDPRGNITVRNGVFPLMRHLRGISFKRYLGSGEMAFYLTISPTEFDSLARLRVLFIEGFVLAESSLEAVLSLRDQLESLTVVRVQPTEVVLRGVEKFTNLSDLNLVSVCGNQPFPSSTFKKSAASLEMMWISNCPLPAITKGLFRGLRNLKYLAWSNSNITKIEAGAFDDLVNAEALAFPNNKIKALPSGLFAKNKKLVQVDFSCNGIRNVSPENFTHVAAFKGGFRLDLGDNCTHHEY